MSTTDPHVAVGAADRPSAADLAAGETYDCSTCGSNWSYRLVRNTGRCPACGGGLRRAVVAGVAPTEVRPADEAAAAART